MYNIVNTIFNKQKQQQQHQYIYKCIYTITETERQSVNQSASIREETIGNYFATCITPSQRTITS